MKIQKLASSALILLCISFSMPSFSDSLTPKIAANASTAESNPKTDELLLRLKEIKEMDKSNLSRVEKKNLRKELKEMKKEARANTKNGIYLSVGAIIIIVLLLILLL